MAFEKMEAERKGGSVVMTSEGGRGKIVIDVGV